MLFYFTFYLLGGCVRTQRTPCLRAWIPHRLAPICHWCSLFVARCFCDTFCVCVCVCWKAGYTPLHTACHFGQMNMIKFLLDHGASVNATTKVCLLISLLWTNFGRRSFGCASAESWNNFSDAVKNSPPLNTFKTRLKCHLFNLVNKYWTWLPSVHLTTACTSDSICSKVYKRVTSSCIVIIFEFFLFLYFILYYYYFCKLYFKCILIDYYSYY